MLRDSFFSAGRNVNVMDVVETNIDTPQASTSTNHYTILLQHMSHSKLMLDLCNHFVEIHECCAQKLKSLFSVTDTETVIQVAQHSRVWLEARKFRITGSRCYEIYTYRQDNWNKKAVTYFFPKSQIKNKYISHGLKYENDARLAYIALTGLDVREFGFVVPKDNLWLGYSPDGVIFENNKPTALLEIKCIFAGNLQKCVNNFDLRCFCRGKFSH